MNPPSTIMSKTTSGIMPINPGKLGRRRRRRGQPHPSEGTGDERDYPATTTATTTGGEEEDPSPLLAENDDVENLIDTEWGIDEANVALRGLYPTQQEYRPGTTTTTTLESPRETPYLPSSRSPFMASMKRLQQMHAVNSSPALLSAPAYSMSSSRRANARVYSSSSSSSPASRRRRGPMSFMMILIYGLVNVALSVPALYGYANIIYRDPLYRDAVPDLAKLVILSSAVHQAVFSLRSTLPFAIAQVQDAGLIFLSSMATTVARNSENNASVAVSTAVVSLSMATAALGVVVMLVGRFRLASVVSLIPTTVVGGYLAFIGLFCVLAGLGLAVNRDVAIWSDILTMRTSKDLMLAIPAVAGGALLTYVSRRYSHDWRALPLTIVILPLLFYAGLFLTGMTLAEARAGDWIAPLQVSDDSATLISKLFDFKLVNWSVVPKMAVEWISMTMLVVFASSLDIVAVEMDLGGAELNIDDELRTVGLSNFISGIFGGYTGSYIFSQTIFTRRTRVSNRSIGIILAVAEVALFLAPFSLMAYFPRFFFAATLLYIGIDLLYEWLWLISFKVHPREYALVLVTFLSITLLNDLVLGIAVGFFAAGANFVAHYATIDPVVVAAKASNVLRDYEGRKLLAATTDERIISLRLSGYLFFGSSTLVLRRVRDFLHNKHFLDNIESKDDDEDDDLEEEDEQKDGKTDLAAESLYGLDPMRRLLRFVREKLRTAWEWFVLPPDERMRRQSAASPRSYTTSYLQSAPRSLDFRNPPNPNTNPSPLNSDNTVLGVARRRLNDFSSQGVKNVNYGTIDNSAPRPTPLSQPEQMGGEADVPINKQIKRLVRQHSASFLKKFPVPHASVSPSGEEEEAEEEDAEVGARDEGSASKGKTAREETKKGHKSSKRRYLIIDFSSVTGVDATTVTTGFLRIRMLTKTHDLKIVFTALTPDLEIIFRRNGIVDDVDVMVRHNLNDGLDYCEYELLLDLKREVQTLREIEEESGKRLRYHTEPEVPRVLWEDESDPEYAKCERRVRASFVLLIDSFFGWGGTGKPSLNHEQTKRLVSYFSLLALRQGDVVFDVGETSDALYVIVSGEVGIYNVGPIWKMLSARQREKWVEAYPRRAFAQWELKQRCRFGSMIGDLGFVLQERRVFSAKCERDSCLFSLSRRRLGEMEANDPALAVGLLKMIGRSLGLTLLSAQNFGDSDVSTAIEGGRD